MCIARTHTHTLRFFYHKQIYAFPSFSYFFIHSFIDAVGRLPIGCWISRRLLPLCIYRIVDAFSFVFINFDLSISGCVARIMCVMYAFVVYIYITTHPKIYLHLVQISPSMWHLYCICVHTWFGRLMFGNGHVGNKTTQNPLQFCTNERMVELRQIYSASYNRQIGITHKHTHNTRTHSQRMNLDEAAGKTKI